MKAVCEDGEALIPALKNEEQQAVKDDLDSIKARYRDVNGKTSARQAALVEALLLSQQFRDIHKEVVTWLDRCEENFRKLDEESVAELQQERIKVRINALYYHVMCHRARTICHNRPAVTAQYHAIICQTF